MSTLRRDNGLAPTAPEPIAFRMDRIVLIGIAVWLLALVATLTIPALRGGDRAWWKWACVTGIVLGGVGYLYVRRGRGNASDAHGSAPANPQDYY